MTSNSFSRLSLLACCILTLSPNPGKAAEGPYHSLKEIPVGGAGGFDDLTIDQEARRLYVPHGTKVVVIDIDKDAIVGEVTETPGVHDFAVAPDLRRGFASNGRESKASIVDLDSLKTVSKTVTGKNPDAMLYDSDQKEVYAFNGKGRSATVFKASTGELVTTIELSGKPQSAALDLKAGRVYCTIEDKDEVVVLDTKKHLLVEHWSVTPGKDPSGIAIDLGHHRLFVGCGNKLMAMMDSANGKVITSVPIDQDADAAVFDPGTQLAFSSNGEGTVTIAHEDSADKLSVIQTLKTQKGAKTMAIDLKTHRIYLPVGAAETFKILVYGK